MLRKTPVRAGQPSTAAPPSRDESASGRTEKSAAHTFGSVYDRRRNNFDALRFALATLVIWSHCFPLSDRPQDWFTRISGQIDGGSLAVDGFFILSGFLITQSWLGAPRLGEFATKRLLRIVPALAFAIGFDALIIGPLATEGTISDYLRSQGPWMHVFGPALHRFLIIPGVFSTNPLAEMVNAPMWSLRYEVICYAMVALLGVVFRRRFVTMTLLVFLASWSAPLVLHSLAGIPLVMARLVACFSAGMLCFAWRDHLPYHWGVAMFAAMLLVGTFLSAGFRSAFPIVGGYLLLYFAFSETLGLAKFGRRGDFSYGLYVLAYPIQQLVIHMLGTSISITTFLLLSFPPTLALAVFSWHWIEAPALAHKPRPTKAATT